MTHKTYLKKLASEVNAFSNKIKSRTKVEPSADLSYVAVSDQSDFVCYRKAEEMISIDVNEGVAAFKVDQTICLSEVIRQMLN